MHQKVIPLVTLLKAKLELICLSEADDRQSSSTSCIHSVLHLCWCLIRSQRTFSHPHPASLRPISSNFVFSDVTTMESFLINLTLQTLGLEQHWGSHLPEYLSDICIFEMGVEDRRERCYCSYYLSLQTFLKITAFLYGSGFPRSH